MQQRVEYIDNLRGFAMFLVVLGHVIAWTFGWYGNPSFFSAEAAAVPATTLWWDVIYAFHMPLLFWISGYLMGNPDKHIAVKVLPNYLWRKAYTLLIPFFTAGLLFHVITGEPITKYWFLRTLFIFILLALPCQMNISILQKKGSDIAYLAIVYLLIITGNHYFRGTLADKIFDLPYLMLFPSFAFGFLCRRYAALEKLINHNITFTVSLVIFIFCTYVNHLSDLSGWHLYGLGYLYPYCGIICAYYMFKYPLGGAKMKFLNYLGLHSLEVYILHFYFVISLPQLGKWIIRYMQQGDAFNMVSGSTIELVVCSVIAVVVCLFTAIAIRILRTSDIISWFLFGRENDKNA